MAIKKKRSITLQTNFQNKMCLSLCSFLLEQLEHATFLNLMSQKLITPAILCGLVSSSNARKLELECSYRCKGFIDELTVASSPFWPNSVDFKGSLQQFFLLLSQLKGLELLPQY